MSQNFNYLKRGNSSTSGAQNKGYPTNLQALSGLLLLGLGNKTGDTSINCSINLQHEARDFLKFIKRHYKKLLLMANSDSPYHLNVGTHLAINPVTQQCNIDFNETRTSSPINISTNESRLHNVFESIAKNQNYLNMPFIVQNNATVVMPNKANHSPADSGYSPTFLEDQLNFPAPILASSLLNHIASHEYTLPFETLAEYEKIERESHHLKQTFIETKLAECPVDYGYNESKSRLRRTYEDPVMEEGRAKNNLASRRSRYKKKFSSRLLSINYDYDLIENRNLFQQEQWLLTIIHELEQQIFRCGIDTNTLKVIRNKCGLK